MVVSLVGPVRYGVIYLNGESCSVRSLGSCPKRRKRHGYAGMENSGIWNGNCPKVLGFVSRHQILISNSSPDIPILARQEKTQKKFFEKIKFYARNSR